MGYQNIKFMSEKPELSKGMYWGLFVLGLAACVGFLFFGSPWFWTTLPFLLTGLTGALDGM